MVVKMKYISYNIRGLGSWEKRKEIQKLVKQHRPWILCVQETKLEVINEFLCVSLWGNQNFGFSYRPSVGASGGILTLWNKDEVDVRITRSMAHVIIIQGFMVKNGGEFALANVYAPCDSVGRQDVWLRLGLLLNNLSELSWCVCGDFNAIRSSSERRSRIVGSSVFSFKEFH
jgi:exonuclease III